MTFLKNLQACLRLLFPPFEGAIILLTSTLLHILIFDRKCSAEVRQTQIFPQRFTTLWASLSLLLFLNGFHLCCICTFYYKLLKILLESKIIQSY